MPDHGPCLTAGCMPGLHSTFLLRPEGKVIKKPLVRWDLIGTDLEQALRNKGTGLEVGKWGRRLVCSLGQKCGW